MRTPPLGRTRVEPEAETALPSAAPAGSPDALDTHGGIARDTALTLAAFGIPLLVGLSVMPVIARNLGPARFGLLGLAWALLEYFSLFDVGLGRATTKFVAERVATGRRDVGQVVVLSIVAQTAVGTAAGAALAIAAPGLIGRVFDVPAGLAGEAVAVFRVLGLTVPFVLLALGLRGVLEATQRFGVSTLIRIPSSSATFLIPAAGAALGAPLPTILLLMLLARAITCAALMVAVQRALRGVRWRSPAAPSVLPRMFAYGGWVAVSNIVSPVLIYFDRFALGAAAGLAAVGYYTVPYELTSRLLVVAGAVGTAIFPAVTMIAARADAERLPKLFASSVRNLALVMAPPVAILVAFAPDVLTLWLGPTFAANGAGALRILAVGVLVNALVHVPYAYLQALGRPDVPAKCHLAELVLHVPLTWLLVRHFGVVGAAVAWTTRVMLDAILLFAAARHYVGVSPREVLAGPGARTVIVILGLAAALAAAMAGSPPLSAARGGAAAVAVLGFLLYVWRFVLDGEERRLVGSLLRRAR